MSSRDRLSSATFTSDGRFLSSRTSFPQGSRSSLPDETCYSTRSSLPDDYESEEEDVFDIPPKHPSMESLEKWKKATLTLNPARRFRYTVHAADVMPEIERVQSARLQKFRTSAHALRAAQRFKLAGAAFKRRAGGGLPPVGFDVAPDRLQRLIQERNIGSLEELGGVVGLANLLRTDPDKGINGESEDLQERKNAYGTNTYPRKSPKNLFAFLWDACKDPTLVILMVCAALSLAFGIKSHGIKEGWYDGASIAFAVILVIFVTAVSDFKQSLQFRSLNEEKRNIQLQVVRGGRRFQLSIFEIVVGDIIPLKIGDQIPADGIFVSGHSLAIDESSMTGESDIVHIDRKHPFLLSGCKVADGYGSMIVTGVGMHTEWGQLMAVIGEELGEETPLQVRLNGIATFIGQIGLTVAVLVFVILIIFYFTGHASGSAAKFRAGHTDADDAVDHVVDIFAIAVTIIVVAVPEGLPLAVTLTLAYSMRKMMDDKALVRRLSACETMGSATTICSDKTGTLTLNQMTVVKAWVAGEMEEPVENWRRLSSMVISLLHEGIGQNSTGSVFISKESGEREVTGSPTEKAVLLWGLETGMVFEDVRSKSTILQAETFSSLKKRAGVAVRVADSEKVHIHWKGAAEIILRLCDKLLDATGSTLAMSEVKRLELLTEIEGMASASLRCLAFAFRELDTQEVPTIEEELESWRIPETQLTLMAIVGIKDPCRPGVREAVQLCINAGVRVRMVTGDNLITATAIASDCGILDQGGITIEGSMLRNYSQGDLDINAPNILVMARSSPSDKLLLVQTLKELGNVVAVTGDGTNDAPALHDADIGLAMGIQGTEVAKESADIIILDDNFASVVKVVRWGRSVYSNIQKFIQFQLTVNVAALVINFIAAVTSGDVPLTAVQLLWVNLIMDTLGALALATEPPSDELMLRPPIGRKEAIVTNVMLRNILGQAIYQLIVLLTLQFKGKKILKLTSPNANVVKNTIIFNAFVLCQIFNEINARKPTEFNIFKGLFRNRLFVGIITITTILQAIIVEFLNKFASTVKLSWQHWVICIAIGSLSWPIAFFVKLIPVPEKPILNRILRPRKHKRKHHPLEDVPDSERGEPLNSGNSTHLVD